MRNNNILATQFGSEKSILISVLLIVLLVKIVLSYCFHRIATELGIDNIGNDNLSIVETIAAVIILGPFVESLIFQFGIQELILHFSKETKYKFILCIAISSLTFALTHYDSIFHTLISLTSGVIYSSLYLFIKDKTARRSLAFCAVWIVHSLFNMSEFLIYSDYQVQ